MKRGDSGDPVADLQRRLNALGVSTGGDPGNFGSSTEEAVRLFQASRRLRIDGLCGPQTWSALVEASYRLGDRLIYLHSPMFRGDDVADLQMRLGALGFDTGRVDGIFGPQTEAALAKFQRNVGLVPDGIFGKASGAELIRLGTRGGGPSLVAEVKEREALRSGPQTLAERTVSIGHEGDVGPLVQEVAHRLRLAGATVILTDDPEGTRQAQLANTVTSDAHLALSSTLDLNGSLSSYYAGFRYESQGGKRLAALLQDHIANALPDLSHTASGMSIPLLRETRMTAVICEIGPPEMVVSKCPLLASAISAALAEWATGS